MKTAIVYRANPHLDANLLPLSGKVEFFVRFEPTDLPSDEDEINTKVADKLRKIGILNTARFFADLTTARGVKNFATHGEDALSASLFLSERMHIISQETGPLETHIRQIADEWSPIPIIVVHENLADHVQIDGIDPYSLEDKDRRLGGWYHAKVLAIWERVLKARGASYQVASIHELDRDVIPNVVIVCDHHCINQHYQIRKAAGARWCNAFLSLPPGKFTKLEDILSHCL